VIASRRRACPFATEFHSTFLIASVLDDLGRRAHQSNGQDKCGRNSGSFATLAAIRRASSR
jgi:hypothetical protein